VITSVRLVGEGQVELAAAIVISGGLAVVLFYRQGLARYRKANDALVDEIVIDRANVPALEQLSVDTDRVVANIRAGLPGIEAPERAES
jgi:hypothetical protein